MATYSQEQARRGRYPAVTLPNSSNHSPTAAAPAAPAAPAMVPVELPVATMPAVDPMSYGYVQGIDPCALGLCDEQTITATGGPTIGGGVFAAPQVVGELSPQADAWYARAAERTFGGRNIAVPQAASERAALDVLGLMDNPAYAERVQQLAPMIGVPAAAAQARSDVAGALGMQREYLTAPAFGADQRLLDTAQQQAVARAAATGVYDQLGVWNTIRPNSQALIPTVTPQGVGVAVQNAQGGIDVIPTNNLAGSVATPQSVQRDALAAQQNAARQQQALAAARLRLAAARQAQAARLAGEQAVQAQRDAAAATRQEDRLKSKASAATTTPKL